MSKNADGLSEIDEVQRCRDVRRALERAHPTLDDLCDWLDKLERARQRKPSRRSDEARRRRAGKRSITT